MWQYHYHVSWRSDHFTQNVTVGYGWYIVFFAVIVGLISVRVAPSIRKYRRSKRAQARRRDLRP